MKPSASIVNDPARVKSTLPPLESCWLLLETMKKPSPEIARSVEEGDC
jgi:hypothetical protein